VGLILFALLGLLLSCGGDDTGSSTATLSASVTPTTKGTATVSPNATAGPSAVTLAELTAVAAAMFPADPSGGYTSCENVPGRAGPPTYDSCPVTSRLKSRLLQIQSLTPEFLASPICRCQSTSDKRDILATSDGLAGTALVMLFGGTVKLELAIVQEGGQLLVDDMRCAGDAASSIYNTPVACR
jgi:hypothetical protein